MRYYPAAIALSLLAAVTASGGIGAERAPDPRAALLVSQGQAALDAGEYQRAVDSFEAALVVDPGHSAIYVELAEVYRREGLQGKAIRYFRSALERDPDNLAAISGEGAALAEKGALDQAKLNLSKIESLCGGGCSEAQTLATAIAEGPKPRVLAAEATAQDSPVTQN